MILFNLFLYVYFKIHINAWLFIYSNLKQMYVFHDMLISEEINVMHAI